MHTGLTCKDYDQMLKNAKNQQIKSEHWKKCNTKSCPKCNIPIEKNDGCDHMTCGKCKHEFCWLCLEDYKMIKRGDNSLHKRSCKYYR
jgi:E3 ubiquitin-protein ligase RNF14